jgi:diguanylate cyclase (GGDEF)-like protein/PAS domain S-box-containing protein
MISHDVTALKRVEAERARLIAILEESPDFVAFASPEGRILYLNRAGRSVLGLAPEETGEELTIFDVYPAWARERIKHEGLPIALRDGIWVGETAILQRDGREVPGLQTIIAHRDGFGRVEYVSTVARDITLVKQTQERLLDAQSQLEAANAELEKLAHQDALTEVGNRRLFDEGLRAAVELAQESGEPFSLVMLDVDHFKQFNDLHGHPAGDDILREVARILQCTLWPSDVVTRYGGEEFGLLLPATGVTGSIRAAERCRRAIESAPWRLRPITASFGVATWEGEDAQTILVRADLALYTAKQAGRNCVRHSNG